jgi:hypothetical protein
MPGNVICLDALKREALWKKDLAKEYQLVEFPCPKTSPLIENDLLIVAIGGKPGACVVALDKDSGKDAQFPYCHYSRRQAPTDRLDQRGRNVA